MDAPAQRWRLPHCYLGRVHGFSGARPSGVVLTSSPYFASRIRAADNAKLATSPSLLEVRDLSVAFRSAGREVEAVRGLSYEVREGECLAIVGESGSGKTAAARAVMGIIPPNGRIVGGSVTLAGDLLPLGKPHKGVPRSIDNRIAMVFQDPTSALNPAFSVGWQIAEMFRIHEGLSRSAARRRATLTMKRVGIPDPDIRFDFYPHELSGGMRQRVVIAMAVALSPRVLIADEPTTSLDVTVEAQVMDLLQNLRHELGMSLILISHNLGLVATVADRVLVMYAGSEVEVGPVMSVYRAPAHPYTAALLAATPSLTRRADRLNQIVGAPPQLSNIPEGCPYHPRCDLAAAQCRVDIPRLLHVGADRKSACHFREDVLRGLV